MQNLAEQRASLPDTMRAGDSSLSSSHGRKKFTNRATSPAGAYSFSMHRHGRFVFDGKEHRLRLDARQAHALHGWMAWRLERDFG